MARLALSLLGSFRVTLDGQPVTSFEYDKVRALMAYLAVESDRPQRRETLAGLLWPERPERSARRNLSQTLFTLRRAIGDQSSTKPFLLVDHWTVQFNRDSDHWLDVAAFADSLHACERHHPRRLRACETCLAWL